MTQIFFFTYQNELNGLSYILKNVTKEKKEEEEEEKPRSGYEFYFFFFANQIFFFNYFV
jgi:hypothetical protein